MQVELLLGSGADPASCNSEGESPLHIVAAHRSVKRVMSLLAHGADITATTKYGGTALSKAAGRDVKCRGLLQAAMDKVVPRSEQSGSSYT